MSLSFKVFVKLQLKLVEIKKQPLYRIDNVCEIFKEFLKLKPIQKEELLTADRLDAKDGSQDLANQIYDLQDEVCQVDACGSSALSDPSVWVF